MRKPCVNFCLDVLKIHFPHLFEKIDKIINYLQKSNTFGWVFAKKMKTLFIAIAFLTQKGYNSVFINSVVI